MNAPAPKGLLIAIEGIDGAGKTTLAHSIVTELMRTPGQRAIYSKEPTHGPWGQRVRESAHTGRLSLEQEVEFLEKDRQQHVAEVIEPELRKGVHVVLDRYFYSTAAYQGAAGADVISMLERNLEFAPRPDVTILLDLPVDVGLERIRRRGDKPNSFETVDTLSRCREIFLAIQLPEVVRINASMSIDEVHNLAMGNIYRVKAEQAIAEHGFTVEAAEKIYAFAAH
ncbi:MAG: dTMP kinase [Dokdonella sp.]|uniref:dTMP kinase n=1 Tax=Dokdonella sp. TaxID=2291710 RepID=UPI003F7D6432